MRQSKFTITMIDPRPPFFRVVWSRDYVQVPTETLPHPPPAGYICSLSNVLPSGCCRADASGSNRYDCTGCLDNGCCSVYEHCVSCCLHPDKQPLLRSILSRSTESFHPLYSSLRDQFELCLSKCRWGGGGACSLSIDWFQSRLFTLKHRQPVICYTKLASFPGSTAQLFFACSKKTGQ